MAKLLRDKPKWFDLSKYPKKNDDFNLYEWAYNFHVRQNILANMDNVESDEIKESIQECRDEGFVREFFSISSKQVQLLTGIEVSELNKTLPEQTLDIKKIHKKMMKLHDPCSDEWKALKINSELKQPCDMPEGKLYVSVDLNTPLNELINQFDKLIREKQAVKMFKTGITEERIDKWIKYQVLAYIDLDIYAIEKKQRLAKTDAGRWLFPEQQHRDVADIIKRHTKPLVDELLKSNYINYIVNQSGKLNLFKK